MCNISFPDRSVEFYIFKFYSVHVSDCLSEGMDLIATCSKLFCVISNQPQRWFLKWRGIIKKKKDFCNNLLRIILSQLPVDFDRFVMFNNFLPA